MKALQEKYEAEQIKSLSLTSQNTSLVAAATAAIKTMPSEGQMHPQKDAIDASKTANSKKKGKGKKAQTMAIDKTTEEIIIHPRLDLKTIFKDLKSAPILRSSEESLFSSFSSFDQLACAFPTNPTLSQKTLLLSTTIRALKSLSRALKALLTSISSCSTSVASPSKPETVQTLNVLLTHLLYTCFSLLFPSTTAQVDSQILASQTDQKKSAKKNKNKEKTIAKKPDAPDSTFQKSDSNSVPIVEAQYSPDIRSLLEKLLDTLTGCILEPLLQAFASLSQTYVSSFFGPTTKSKNNFVPAPDIRPDVLSLFRSAFLYVSQLNVCFELPFSQTSDNSYVSGVRECLSLAAVRIMLRLFDCQNIRDGGPQLCYSVADPDEDRPLPPMVDFATPGNAHEQGFQRIPQSSIFSGVVKENGGRDKVKDSTLAGAASVKSKRLALRRNTRDDRLQKLARKDAVWYLCTILHILFENADFLSDVSGFELSESGARIIRNDDVTSNLGYFPCPVSLRVEPVTRGLPAPQKPHPSTGARLTSDENFISPSKPSAPPGIEASSSTHEALISQSSCRHLTTSTEDRETERYTEVSEAEASASSLALLRTGLLDSFEALLVLLRQCRPPLSSSHSLDSAKISQRQDIAEGTTVDETVQMKEGPFLVEPVIEKRNRSDQGPGEETREAPHVEPEKQGHQVKASAVEQGTEAGFDSNKTMDEVEYEMILGVVERYWECTLGLELGLGTKGESTQR
ncbi:hypothetical protein BDP27DRAFT_1448339 [Rhodocollybia butyracea]|uniref:Uncharacterized protein n=1 Tax=Rhodocollybia butyracea TaxID=206335 RepID=A0A9P5PUY8_9AGAR|nr:hypothetical protein BDP27DRAFT_1448339 [Rhodocollybia butyracea]